MKRPQLKLTHLNSLLTSSSRAQASKLARLFFYTDGFQLSAAVIAREGDKLKILASAQQSANSPEALNHVLTDLATQTPQLPQQAIMLHLRMALGLLDLPNAEGKPLSDEKISNIMRWEMETLYGEQVPQWTIGSLLVQLGIIDGHERDAIIAEQIENRHKAASFGGKLPRFGEILLAQGRLDQTALDHCLNLQADLQDKESAMSCGWYKTLAHQQVLCAAISTEEHTHWMQVFADAQLRVERFYPVMGSLAALLEAEDEHCLIELHPSCLVCSYLADGHFQHMEVTHCMDKSLTVDDICAALSRCESSFKSVYIWGNHPRAAALIEQLQPRIEASVILLAWPEAQLIADEAIKQNNSLMPFLAVAQDYFFQDLHTECLAYVQGVLPPPAWYLKREWQLIIAGFVITSILVGTDIYFHHKVLQMKTDIERLDNNYKRLKTANKKQNRENRHYLKLDKRLQGLEVAYEELQLKKSAIEVNLIERQKFMSALLPLLITSIDKEVVLDSFNEDSWYQFRLSGWALNQAAINRFQQALSRSLAKFQMKISKSPSILLTTGDLAGGYRFDFELVRDKQAGSTVKR